MDADRILPADCEGGGIVSALYRGETVRIVSWHRNGQKAKIATKCGLRWAQKSELEVIA